MNENDTLSTDESPQTHQHFWVWIALLAVILLTSAIRIRLLAVPFERDEGEYAYAGQLILQGIPPYEKAYNMKMPGIYAAYALILAVFGQTHISIHLGLVFINTATIILVFLLAKELFGPLAGLFAGTAFALLSVGKSVQSIFANAEHFVILPAVGGILLLLRAVNLQKKLFFFASGLLLGIAFMMKQHGVAFILFAGLYLLLSEIRRRPFYWQSFLSSGVLFSVGVFLPFVLTCLVLWWCGVFERFWFWTFDYAQKYVSLVPVNIGLRIFKTAVKEVAGSAVCLWGLAGIGLVCLFVYRRFRSRSLFVAGFLFFSFLSVCPGLYFRPHYFILLLPAVAILAGIGTVGVCETFARLGFVLIGKIEVIILAAIVLFFTLYQQWDYFFVTNPAQVSRDTYGANPFPESLEIAKFIKQNSREGDTIAVFGSEPQIYFYSGRRSATGYVYTYPLMERQPYALKMQEEMINQIEQANPKFLVLVHVYTSWLIAERSEKRVFYWFDKYASRSYQLIGVVDIISSEQTVYRWGPSASLYSPQSQNWLYVLRHNRYGDSNNVVFPGADATDSSK